jgi:predicted transposase YbfD/YdcC
MPRNPNKIDYSGGLPAGFSSFAVIEDPRTGNNRRHHFGEVLFMCVTGVLCGMRGFADVEDFATLQIEWFRKWISLPNGVPRAQTFSNIFQLIEPALFIDCMVAHVAALGPEFQARIIAVDGKALRGSHDLLKAATHAVSAWAAGEGVTLAQEFVAEKSNEITALPGLLEMLDLEGAIVTIDSMGTQTKVASQIIDQKGDYVLALKGNQGNTHKEVIDHFDFALRQLDLKQAKGWSHHQHTEKSHGRLTVRTVLATANLETIDAHLRARWSGLKSLVVVECQTTELSGGKQRKTERRYYLSSLQASAEQFQEIIRSHWSIENQCHWVLDVVFGEDHNRIRKNNAPKNFATLLRIVLNILKLDDTLKGSLAKKRRHALLDTTYREKLLSLA